MEREKRLKELASVTVVGNEYIKRWAGLKLFGCFDLSDMLVNHQLCFYITFLVLDLTDRTNWTIFQKYKLQSFVFQKINSNSFPASTITPPPLTYGKFDEKTSWLTTPTSWAPAPLLKYTLGSWLATLL
jgi:hypothetical protein